MDFRWICNTDVIMRSRTSNAFLKFISQKNHSSWPIRKRTAAACSLSQSRMSSQRSYRMIIIRPIYIEFAVPRIDLKVLPKTITNHSSVLASPRVGTLQPPNDSEQCTKVLPFLGFSLKILGLSIRPQIILKTVSFSYFTLLKSRAFFVTKQVPIGHALLDPFRHSAWESYFLGFS